MPANTKNDTRAQYWQKQIKAWQASGQSQQAFCKSHALNYPRFVYWLRKFRKQSDAHQHGMDSDFVPVTLPMVPPSVALCVVLPNGLELRGISAANLALVHQLVERWS